ncbi:MAG: hypothetical protein HC830_06115 [Bacteroidetes bacterium]|nr:hypothetical protein [Bacteroidota bacterium]
MVSGLLHEVIAPFKIMESIYKLCSAKTIIHVNVPNAYSLHRLIAKEAGLIKSLYELSPTQKRLQQNHTFDFNSLKDLCDKAGFECMEQGSILIKPFTHLQMEQLIDFKIIGTEVLEGLYKLANQLPEFGSEIYLNLIKKEH